jgi:hypothetical protein
MMDFFQYRQYKKWADEYGVPAEDYEDYEARLIDRGIDEARNRGLDDYEQDTDEDGDG